MRTWGPRQQAEDRRKRAKNPKLYRKIALKAYHRRKLRDPEGLAKIRSDHDRRNKDVIRVARRLKVSRKVARRWLAEGRATLYAPGYGPKGKL